MSEIETTRLTDTQMMDDTEYKQREEKKSHTTDTFTEDTNMVELEEYNNIQQEESEN